MNLPSLLQPLPFLAVLSSSPLTPLQPFFTWLLALPWPFPSFMSVIYVFPWSSDLFCGKLNSEIQVSICWCFGIQHPSFQEERGRGRASLVFKVPSVKFPAIAQNCAGATSFQTKGFQIVLMHTNVFTHPDLEPSYSFQPGAGTWKDTSWPARYCFGEKQLRNQILQKKHLILVRLKHIWKVPHAWDMKICMIRTFLLIIYIAQKKVLW